MVGTEDDFLLFLGEVLKIICEPKSIIPKPVFLTLTLNRGGGLVIEIKQGADWHRKGRGLVLGLWIDCRPERRLRSVLICQLYPS